MSANNKYFLDFGAHLLEGFNQFLELNIIDSTYHCLSFEANPHIFAKCLVDKLPESRLKVSSLFLINCAVSGKSPNSKFTNLINLNSCRVVSQTKGMNSKDLRSFTLSQARAIREFLKRIFYSKKILIEQNVIATQASNILNNPPETDFGFTFAYDTEKVAAIDIVDILKTLENPQEVIIKMDIEGAEFLALESLLSNLESIPFNTSKLKIYIEWHERFFKDQVKYTQLRRNLEINLKQVGISVFEWK